MTVEWLDRARNQWALIWVTATVDERDEFEKAYREINDRLARNAQFLGEGRWGNERAWFHPPLVVRFRLIPHGPIEVLHVARTRKTDNPPAGDDPDS
jgi:hypothetical protein